MCRPASMYIGNNGRTLYWSKNTESHKELIREFGLQENEEKRIYGVAVEISPPDGDLRQPLDKWIFKVDQDLLPDWWDAELAENMARAELPHWYAAKVITDGQSVDEITSGQWYIVGGRVGVISGTASVREICGGRVRVISGMASVRVISGGRVGVICGAANVGVICGGSVGEISGTASVGEA